MNCSSPYKINLSPAPIGLGAQGVVYESCLGGDLKQCKTLTKIQSLGSSPEMHRSFFNVADIQQVAAKKNLAPHIREIRICDKPLGEADKYVLGGKESIKPNTPLGYFVKDEPYGFTVMDRARGISLSDWKKELAKAKEKDEARARHARMCKAIAQSVQRLHKLGIFHGDMHDENIFYDEGKKRVMFIDFSDAIQPPSQDERLDELDLNTALYSGECGGRFKTQEDVLEAVDALEHLLHP